MPWALNPFSHEIFIKYLLGAKQASGFRGNIAVINTDKTPALMELTSKWDAGE